MGRKEKDFIMCKLDKNVACCGCAECLDDKREEYEYKKTDVWNVWMDERPVMVRQDGTIRKL